MYRAAVVATLLLTVAATANAKFSVQVRIKNAPQVQGRYFDPHNHFNGVLRYRVLGGISKTGQREIEAFLSSQQGEELKRLLPAPNNDNDQARVCIQEYLAHHDPRICLKAGGGQAAVNQAAPRAIRPLTKLLYAFEGSLLKLLWRDLQAAKGRLANTGDAERMAAGTQTLQQFLDCGPTDDPSVARRLLKAVLTATPQNDFDAAYVARSLIDIDRPLQLQATLDELAHEQIGYVEMSHSITKFALGSADKKPDGFLNQELTDILLKAEGAGGIQLRWLPMLRTGLLADDGEGRTRVLDRERGQCQPSGPNPAEMLKPLQPGSDGKSQLELVLAQPLVVGFDMASPERSCYTERGAGHFAETLAITFRVAQAERKRLVAHVHVGEGFPVFASSGVGNSVSCKNPKVPRQMEPIWIKYQGNLPLHAKLAENNIDILLAGVARFREKLKENAAKFDEYVEVRFGHVTHATLLQAKRMRELHVFADVNLTSNLATGALTRPDAEVEEGSDIVSARPLPLGDLRQLAHKPENAWLFKAHSLIKLLAQGVPVVLGTDGAGVEHSNLEKEYALAEVIIAAAWKDFSADRLEFLGIDDEKVKLMKGLGRKDLAWLKQAVSLKRLYENQHEHYRFISAPPGPGSRWPDPQAAQRIWQLLQGS